MTHIRDLLSDQLESHNQQCEQCGKFTRAEQIAPVANQHNQIVCICLGCLKKQRGM